MRNWSITIIRAKHTTHILDFADTFACLMINPCPSLHFEIDNIPESLQDCGQPWLQRGRLLLSS